MCACVCMCVLVSLIFVLSQPILINQAGARLLLFSYGSGLASSMFSIKVGSDAKAREALRKMKLATNLEARLAQRVKMAPEDFSRVYLCLLACLLA